MVRGRSSLTVAVRLVVLLPLLLPRPAVGSSGNQAAAAYARGQLLEALQLLPTPMTPEARLLRGRTLLRLGRFKEASVALKGLIGKLPHLRDLIRHLQGEALLGAGKHIKAAERFRATARAKGSHWVDQAWRRRADALRLGKQHALATREYQHLLRIYPEHPDRPTLELHLAHCLRDSAKGRRPQHARLRAAATALREITYRWPAHKAAAEARADLERLLARTHLRLKPQPLSRRLQRARALRWGKRYDKALVEVLRLRRLAPSRSADAAALDLELMRLYLKREEPAKIVSLYEERFASRAGSRSVRRLLADALARLGRVDQALEVLAGRGMLPGGQKLRPDTERMIRLLREHARYSEALKLVRQQVARLPKKRRKRALLGQPWLAYRAGEHDLAIEGFRHLARHAARQRPFALYWEARTQARAGRAKQAEALYRQLMEKHLRTYYGLQARGRLAELGKINLSSTSTCTGQAPAIQDSVDPEVLGLMDKLITRHGDLYPSLRRARTLWELGMLEDSRRELRLIAIDFAWTQVRGRPRWYIHRPAVERIWRGAKPPPRRWTRHARGIYKHRATLALALGELMERAGIFFYGWRFKPRHPDPARHWHPKAHARLVLRTAEQLKLDPNLVWAVMKTESSFRTDVVSRAGAIGLMQIMPVTARRLAGEMKLRDFKWHRLFVPEVNLAMAGWYLQAVSNKFKGQLMLVAAAYNGGPHNVARWLDQRGRSTDLDEFIEEIPFTESRRYAKKIFRLVTLYERVYCSKDDRIAPNSLDVRYSEHPDY